MKEENFSAEGKQTVSVECYVTCRLDEWVSGRQVGSCWWMDVDYERYSAISTTELFEGSTVVICVIAEVIIISNDSHTINSI